MKELMVILRKYIEITKIPVNERDFYDQRKVENLEMMYSKTMDEVIAKRFGELMVGRIEEVIDKRVEEALEHHECGTYHNDSEY
jgi:hypothetical protein